MKYEGGGVPFSYFISHTSYFIFDMNSNEKIIIIGGGIAGLSAAIRLAAAGKSAVVYLSLIHI